MTKVKNTMVQDQDQLPAHGLAQSPVPGHILDLAQDPVHDPILARGQAQGADQGQEVGAVHASIVPHLVVGHVPVLGKRKDLTHDPDLGLVVHITTDIEDPAVCLHFPPENGMLEAGTTLKVVIAWEFLD